MRFEVPDDSGFLAHFREAMAARSLLLWGTGGEDSWVGDDHAEATPRFALSLTADRGITT